MSSFALSLKSRQPRTLMSSVMLNEHSFSSRKGFTWWCVKNRFFSGLVNLPLNSDSGTYLTCNFPKVTYVVSGETGLQMSWAWFLGPNPSHYTTMPLKESFQWHHGLGVFFFFFFGITYVILQHKNTYTPFIFSVSYERKESCKVMKNMFPTLY